MVLCDILDGDVEGAFGELLRCLLVDVGFHGPCQHLPEARVNVELVG
jgi:hypothetical protein